MMTFSELIEESIDRAVFQAQVRLKGEEGKIYKPEDLKQAFLYWLELSLEQLADEAMYHAFEGMDCYAFNRRAFKEQLKKLQPSAILLA